MWDDGNGSGIDNLSYVCPAFGGKAINNRLKHIIDHTTGNGGGAGVVAQNPGNYSYDATGNLTADVTEGITSITWTPYNTIRGLVKTNAALALSTTTLRYLYDAAGNRVVKDYYPFGMQMDTKTWEAGGVAGDRYAYNGKENDDEVKGQGNQQDYGFRIYDPHVARFLSVDPLARSFPWNSCYAFAENDVIRCADLDGLEKLVLNTEGSSFVLDQHVSNERVASASLNFTLNHPIIGCAIGKHERGSTNITTIAGHTARYMRQQASFTHVKGLAYGTNDFRHIFWQAIITSRFGREIANAAGKAHEGVSMNESLDVNINTSPPSDLLAQDRLNNVLNNEIGRRIGEQM